MIVTAVSILLQPSAMSVLKFSPTRATFSSVTTAAVTTGHIPVGLSSTKSTKSITNSVVSLHGFPLAFHLVVFFQFSLKSFFMIYL